MLSCVNQNVSRRYNVDILLPDINATKSRNRRVAAYETTQQSFHLIYCEIILIFFPVIFISSFCSQGGSDSESHRYMMQSVMSDMSQPSSAVHKKLIEKDIENDHSAGQTIIANHITALFFQNISDLVFASVLSASTAWATETFHPVIPSILRARNSISIGSRTNQNISVSGNV